MILLPSKRQKKNIPKRLFPSGPLVFRSVAEDSECINEIISLDRLIFKLINQGQARREKKGGEGKKMIKNIREAWLFM